MPSAARSTENRIAPAAVEVPAPSIEVAKPAPRPADDVASWRTLSWLSERLRGAERERFARVLTSSIVPLSAQGTREVLDEMMGGVSFERAEARSAAADAHARGMMAPRGHARRRSR